MRLVECGFYDPVAVAYVLSCVGEVALDEALEHVEDYAVSGGGVSGVFQIPKRKRRDGKYVLL